MKALTTSLAALALSTPLAFAAGIDARVTTAQVALGDRFQLVLTADGQGPQPDLTPLYAGFDVLGTAQSSQTQVINGRMSQSQSWVVTLSPKAQGAQTIPALTAGALSSDPVRIEVLDASQLPKAEGVGGISVEATLDGATHYQFQEIPLNVRIETAQPLQRAELIAPTGDFELTQTGQDRRRQITRDGQPVTLVERSYLLRPQSTGALTIPPFTLRGSLADPEARRAPFGRGFGGRDPFAMMDRMMAQIGGGMGRSPFEDLFGPDGTPFVARSEALRLDVAANPSGGSGWFLPAKAVELRADWPPEAPSLRAGEAVTRRISLLALGARPEQLPDLTFPDAPGLRIYLDDTETDLVETAEGTVARKDFLVSIVPTQGGALSLPALSVTWLDTASGETKTATLPALDLTAEGAVPAPEPQAPDAALEEGRSPGRGGHARLWTWGAALFGGLAAIGAVAALRRRAAAAERASPPRRRLLRAARSGNPKAVYQALVSLRAAYPDEVAPALSEIEAVIWAGGEPGREVDLLRLVRPVVRAIGQRRKTGLAWGGTTALPALYPAR